MQTFISVNLLFFFWVRGWRDVLSKGGFGKRPFFGAGLGVVLSKELLNRASNREFIWRSFWGDLGLVL